jgi:hypothetical protein
MSAGVLIILCGVWVIVQVIGGDALQRLKILEES